MKPTKLVLRPLAAGAITLLAGATGPAHAQSSNPAPALAASPPTVVVTGSRIPRASLEGPSAVTILTGEEISKQGYKNVFDALNSQVQNSGFTTGADFGNTYTPSANTISLRGLGPNHTLILLNGRRLADFPIAYEGEVNFTNLANIPSSVVERIEILNGGASAVYGSDAIAGVVNIILKKKAEGVDVNLKAGATSRGGGGDRRLQLTGGGVFGRLNTLYTLELSERDPLWSMDRAFMSSKGGAPTKVVVRKNLDTGKYFDLGDACAGLGDLFDHSLVKVAAPGGGAYCASPKVSPTYWTTQTKNSSQNFFGSANYDLSGDTTLFGELLLGRNRTANNTRGPSWTSASTTDSYFYNQNSGSYETWTRYLAPEEFGGVKRYDRHWNDQASSLSVGAKGGLPGTQWNYEAGYSASLYTSRNHVPRALANIDRYFLGPRLGADPDGVAIYAPDPARLARRLTPAEFDTITGQANSDDKSWTNTVSLVTNGGAFELPAGPVQLATVAELGKQGYSNTPDARYNQGYFNSTGTSNVTAGTRKRYALGLEANLPILARLNGTLAGRYDRYSFAGRSDGKFTYNGGLELRPAGTLLLRSNYATSFRAPDMNYIYKARGTGYYAASTDYYRCAQAGQPIDGCEFANVSPGYDYVQTGSKDLKPEQGKSFGLGAVWSPGTDFDVSLDYWHIKIDDLVTNLDEDKLLRDEAWCRQANDSSQLCADTLARIVRYPLNALYKPGEVKEIHVNPINAAYQQASGLDVSARYQLRTAGHGVWIVKANYARSLAKKSRQFAGDALRDDLEDLANQDWRDKLNTSLTWNVGDWSHTLFLQRYGKVPNAGQTAYLSPTTLVNLSTVYHLNRRATVSLAVNNLFNHVKMDDTGGWPYYPVGNYSPVGRQGWIEFNYHFGS